MAPLRQILLLSSLAGLAAVADSKKLRKREALPDYAITYSPYSYLYSGESYFPSDITTHLENTSPYDENYLPLGAVASATVDNLDTYGTNVFLTSADGLNFSTSWLTSGYGKPDSSGYSAAPSTIIAVEKNATWTDVFYFYFYSYNYGGKTLDINFDDHVGDWEHAMIRFYSGVPYGLYLSQHSAGSSYEWSILEFNGSKPVSYIANGGHANYAKAGKIDYTIAFGIVSDTTDAGFGWDLGQNYRGYWYDAETGEFSIAGGASTGGSEEGGETADWLNWQGAWGDQYNSSSPDQFCIFGECKYVNGPTGPLAKSLNRTTMCESTSYTCTLFTSTDDVTKQD